MSSARLTNKSSLATKWKSKATLASTKVKARRKKEPTLAEINARLAATRERRLEDAKKNCIRLTGKPSL